MIVVAIAELDELLAERPALPPLLRVFLARARLRALDESAWLAQLVTGRAVPPAPLTRLLDAPSDCRGSWLRADPVDLLPDLSAVWIRPGGHLAPDSPALSELREMFAAEGLVFDLPVPERGYLRLDALPDARFVPPSAVHGESLDYVLPSGTEARRWRRLLNEAQVVLHQHARATASAHPGGLWFWGAGELPGRGGIRCRVQTLVGSDPLLRALAVWLDLELASNPQPSRPADASLVEWRPDPDLDAAANLAALNEWLAPQWRRLRLGRLDALELAGRQRAWTLSSARSWRFWQRTPALSA